MRSILAMRARAWPVVTVAFAVLVACFAANAPGAAAATRYTVFAGGGQAGISVDLFRPNVININQGDSIEFKNPFEEIHTVTFLGGTKLADFFIPAPEMPAPRTAPKLIINPLASNPAPATGTASIDATYANSGLLGKGASWTTTFSKTGSFGFVCILHPDMTATVNVLPPGTYVPSQSQRDAEAEKRLTDGLAKGERLVTAAHPGTTPNANGTSTWEVLNTAGPSTAVNRFLPARLQIGIGDSVTWHNPDGFPPHTVTFTSGAPVPDYVMPENRPSGPPWIVFDPKVLLPNKPSSTYEGTGYYNSGFIFTGEAPGGSSFSLTFPKAGTYSYVCVLHADQGMAGVIEVGAPSGRPVITAPATGDAGLKADSSRDAMPFYATGFSFLLLAAAGVVQVLKR